MHPAETFPLILNIGIGIQSLVFAGVQGTGLHSLFIDGCSAIAQFMWPGKIFVEICIAVPNNILALFIAPYIQVVFGLECMRRACRSRPFQPRGKYDVTICLVLIVFMLIGTWIPSNVAPEPDHCFASLLWFISGFGEPGLVILAVVLALSAISAITICVRLSTFTLIDQHQRIAASRMVYYLVLGSISIVSNDQMPRMVNANCFPVVRNTLFHSNNHWNCIDNKLNDCNRCSKPIRSNDRPPTTLPPI